MIDKKAKIVNILQRVQSDEWMSVGEEGQEFDLCVLCIK